MYAKNGYIYFDSIEEAIDQYDVDDYDEFWEFKRENKYWMTRKSMANCRKFWFQYEVNKYRRKLTSDFTVRTEFKEGDPVCWCGANGEVVDTFVSGRWTTAVEFSDTIKTFTSDGIYLDIHTIPSLFHGHDVHKAETQKFPVERVEETHTIYCSSCGLSMVAKKETTGYICSDCAKKYEKPKMSQADKVAECIPHWQENVRLAIEGEKINRGGGHCPLCDIYQNNILNCGDCPIKNDTGVSNCRHTPWHTTSNNKPESCLDMLNYLTDLERRLRKAGK